MKVRYFFQRVETLEGVADVDAENLDAAFALILSDEDRYIYRPCSYDETAWELSDVEYED